MIIKKPASGMLYFRQTNHRGGLDRDDPRDSFIVAGIIAVPRDLGFHGEHRYPVREADPADFVTSPFVGQTGLTLYVPNSVQVEDFTGRLAGRNIAQIMTELPWRF